MDSMFSDTMENIVKTFKNSSKNDISCIHFVRVLMTTWFRNIYIARTRICKLSRIKRDIDLQIYIVVWTGTMFHQVAFFLTYEKCWVVS